MISGSVKITGDPDAFLGALDPTLVRKRTEEAIRRLVIMELARKFAAKLRENMLAGRAEGPGLSASWEKRKGHGRAWVNWGDLAKSITVSVHGDRVMVGVPSSAKSRTGQQLDLVALILEMGSLRVPARKVFEPTAKQFSREIASTDIRLDLVVKEVFKS